MPPTYLRRVTHQRRDLKQTHTLLCELAPKGVPVVQAPPSKPSGFVLDPQLLREVVDVPPSPSRARKEPAVIRIGHLVLIEIPRQTRTNRHHPVLARLGLPSLTPHRLGPDADQPVGFGGPVDVLDLEPKQLLPPQTRVDEHGDHDLELRRPRQRMKLLVDLSHRQVSDF